VWCVPSASPWRRGWSDGTRGGDDDVFNDQGRFIFALIALPEPARDDMSAGAASEKGTTMVIDGVGYSLASRRPAPLSASARA